MLSPCKGINRAQQVTRTILAAQGGAGPSTVQGAQPGRPAGLFKDRPRLGRHILTPLVCTKLSFPRGQKRGRDQKLSENAPSGFSTSLHGTKFQPSKCRILWHVVTSSVLIQAFATDRGLFKIDTRVLYPLSQVNGDRSQCPDS